MVLCSRSAVTAQSSSDSLRSSRRFQILRFETLQGTGFEFHPGLYKTYVLILIASIVDIGNHLGLVMPILPNPLIKINADVAQLAEQLICNQ